MTTEEDPMKAHYLFLAAALVLTGGQFAHAEQQVRQVADIKPSDDPNANDHAKLADMQKNGPSCPLINGSSASRDANTAAKNSESRVGSTGNTLE
jgi:hypothetical protein